MALVGSSFGARSWRRLAALGLSLRAARSARALCGCVLLPSLTACFPSNPSFPDARQPRGVRVLGAVSEPASGVPGAQVVLQLEAFDGAPLLEQLERAAGVLDEAAITASPAPLSVA